jgi:uncharacterized membrane protein YjfL (UPF0719 family)
MFFTRVLVSLFEFTLTVVMSGVAIAYTYKVFVRANPDFDMGVEIRKGNVAVGTLMAAILVAASMILQKGLSSVVSMFRLHMTAPGQTGFNVAQLVMISLSHLVVALIVALMTISITLRLFGKLTRAQLHAGQELEKGNVAVGVVLAAVVLVAALYVGEGVSALSKALVPQPSMGRVQTLK